VFADFGGEMPERLNLDALQEKDGLNKDLGIEYVELDEGRVVMSMPVDARHRQPLGYLHGGASTRAAGGASVVLAETVATVGAWLNCPPGKVAFGSEINASHLRPKRSGTLTGIGTPIQVGRKEQVWEVHIHDEDEKPVCVSRCRLAVVDAED
jgi:1,4-dihydroxy-2-naphthoyl-CoA hydrolase